MKSCIQLLLDNRPKMNEIQLQFPVPGNWHNFAMTSVFTDADGFGHSVRYAPADIPTGLQSALASVVSALVSMAAPWQACQVWARLGTVSVDSDDAEPTVSECINLTVEAKNDSGGRKIFTEKDYPNFVVTDTDAIAFFKYFTYPI